MGLPHAGGQRRVVQSKCWSAATHAEGSPFVCRCNVSPLLETLNPFGYQGINTPNAHFKLPSRSVQALLVEAPASLFDCDALIKATFNDR